ncbi:hypothetical protein BWK63_13920 [Flavobacterium covae]|uniref:hypothetical protein n=1 Tax=Flavobacterium TaxID=237 RepID=UPI000B4D23E2|nr:MULTISPECIES: hypothetical protein [Flavobacterium]OWP79894.1 hypothetical protein BWK63_13920 [Flavobacterium covae]POR20669.1 hypothetical protein BWK57_12835 [Flavobacterium columnare]
MKKIIAIAFFTLFLSCKKKADFTLVKKGMSEKQVIELVGEPLKKEEIPFFGGKFLVYEKDIVVFMDDKVTKCKKNEEFAKEIEEPMKELSKKIDEMHELKNKMDEYKKRTP